MADFIRLEAKEKAAEIRAKAAADAAIEKQNAVRDAKMKLSDDFDKKEKALAVEQKIRASMDESKQRSRLLAARDEFMQKLAAEAQSRLATTSGANAASYAKLLKDLIKQSLVRLDGESKCEVHCRPQDLNVAKTAATSAVSELSSTRKVEVGVVADNALANSSGGVVVWANNGRIKCNNTLEDRLSLVMADLTPVVRDLVFPSARAEVRTKPPVHFAHGGPAPAPVPAPTHATSAAAAHSGASAQPKAADPFAF